MLLNVSYFTSNFKMHKSKLHLVTVDLFNFIHHPLMSHLDTRAVGAISIFNFAQF